MNEISLPGCTPEPLMGYLKALGVFRLVAEQADPAASLSWRCGVARLQTKLDRAGLDAFFLNEYKPTPILAPWNGGSGFYPGGSEPLSAIEQSNSPRLDHYRDAVTRIRPHVPATKPKDDDKETLLVRCRAVLPDDVVPWLDVCFVLGESGPGYFPLLGTGGNDGRLDFTNNYFQRLADILPFQIEHEVPDSPGWLAASLHADSLAALDKAAVGQFNPGGIGGANGVQGGFEAGSRVNPWDFVLMIEGALLFAGSVARRLGVNAASRAVFPFSVESVAVGYGSATASEETTDGSRSELWLPLWDEPATLPEIRQLFAEGRAQVGRRQARNAVEFALAVNLLGVSRGVTSFARYGFLKRNGLAFLAAPLGRVPVTPRPSARLLDDPPFREWLDRLRRACREKDKTPARYQSALRGIDRRIFEFANRSGHGDDAKHLVEVLAAIGRAERTLAKGLRFCQEKFVRPLSGLSEQWLEQADDGTAEFRLAASIAGIRGEKDLPPIRAFLEEVEVSRFVNWSPGSTSAVWSNRSTADNLAAVFRRRQLEAFRAGHVGGPARSPRPARLDDVLAFLRHDTDDDKLAELIWGLIALDWAKVDPRWPEPVAWDELALPTEFGLPRLLVDSMQFAPNSTSTRWQLIDGESEHATKPDPEVFHAIAVGRGDAIEYAARRLRAGGFLAVGQRNRQSDRRSVRVVSPHLAPGKSGRLLASMLFPLSNADLETVANSVLYPPEVQE